MTSQGPISGVSAGVGKVRPAGQIWPAEALNTARVVVFSNNCLVYHVIVMWFV